MLTLSKALLKAVFFAATVALAAPVWGQQQPAPDMVMGEPAAKVTVIEYASMSCPHCADFNNLTFPRIKADYIDTGLIKYIFRDYPLNQPAIYGAVLARCAGPARFFPFIDVLFREQSVWATAPDVVGRLTQIGQRGGLSAAELQTCLADTNLVNSIVQSRLEGDRQFQVAATPTFIVAGQILEGALPYEQFKRAIDDALAGRPVTGARRPGSDGAASNTTTYIVIGLAALLAAAAGFFFLRRPKPRS